MGDAKRRRRPPVDHSLCRCLLIHALSAHCMFALRTVSTLRATPLGRGAAPTARTCRVAAMALSQDELKQQAAWQAVDYVKSGMKVGLGTGSTAAFAVARIGDLLKKGDLADIIAIPTSVATYEQAKSE